jgi:hypothetical protein
MNRSSKAEVLHQKIRNLFSNSLSPTVIARPPITTFEGMLDRAIQRKELDSPVKPENDKKESTFSELNISLGFRL